MKSFFIRLFSKQIRNQVLKDSENAIADQRKILKLLRRKGSKTRFGMDHNFEEIKSYSDFVKHVPVRDYEKLRPYVERITKGESDVLWPGKPKYFAKTSGTTSGVKYIPISKASIKNHINTARNAMLNHIALSGNAEIFNGKMIFVSGSPELEFKSGIGTGRLSGIVNHEVPFWAKANKLPSLETNMIEDWQEKVVKIAEETIVEDMRLIGGIPPWIQMYYESLLKISGKQTLAEIFPNYSLFIYGGVNYKPYEAALESLVGKKIDILETYPASEGFIAFQDKIENEGLLLNTNSGIFFEFVSLDEINKGEPKRLMLEEVELNVDYALIINNNAGLWAYNIGDTVRFTSLDPYRIIVSGRIKHFISAFGEHVIAKEVDEAIAHATKELGSQVIEYTVAPQVNPPEGGLPYHQWYIEFGKAPENMEAFAQILDKSIQDQNIYYKDLIEGEVLRPIKISMLRKNGFQDYMASIGKLGGQNKVPRLSDDRKIADKLDDFVI